MEKIEDFGEWRKQQEAKIDKLLSEFENKIKEIVNEKN